LHYGDPTECHHGTLDPKRRSGKCVNKSRRLALQKASKLQIGFRAFAVRAHRH